MAPRKSLLERLGDRFTLFALRTLTREIRAFRKVLEQGIDSYREINRFPPLFGALPAAPVEQTRAEQLGDGEWSLAGRHMLIWALEELCIENQISLSNISLYQVGKDRGWIDDAGRLLVFPKSAGDLPPQARDQLSEGEG